MGQKGVHLWISTIACCLTWTTLFSDLLRTEVPQLTRLSVMRLCFLDEEGTYIDLTEKNFHRFIRLATHAFKDAVPKINVKLFEGTSPAVTKEVVSGGDAKICTSKRLLFPDRREFALTTYRSPVELEIDLKRREINARELEFSAMESEYEKTWREYNPIPGGVANRPSSKTFCTQCHLRLGHAKNCCQMDECLSATICGQVDRHPSEKKELQELAKKKQKVEGELKALQSELKLKEKITKETTQSFEARIHDILIRSNPSKYLTETGRPKEGIILSDTCVIKKYYGNVDPLQETLQNDCGIFQTIIKSYHDKLSKGEKTPKNSVLKQLHLNHCYTGQDARPIVVPYPYIWHANQTHEQMLNVGSPGMEWMVPFAAALPQPYFSAQPLFFGAGAAPTMATPPHPPIPPKERSPPHPWRVISSPVELTSAINKEKMTIILLSLFVGFVVLVKLLFEKNVHVQVIILSSGKCAGSTKH